MIGISFATHITCTGRRLKILIPAHWAPFWHLVELVNGRRKILADLMSLLWTSKFFVNKCLFLLHILKEKIHTENTKVKFPLF